MKFDDELLARAAIIARDKELATLPRTEDLPDYIFSDELEEKIQELFRKYRNGEIKPRVARLGYPYYMRRGLAAVLICFLLTCIAAPEAVMAGYQRIVEAIRTIVTEYTEWHYLTEGQTDDEFKQARFGYLPNEFVETDSRLSDYRYFVVFKFEEKYFVFDQISITDSGTLGYGSNTEEGQIEVRYIHNDEVKFVFNKRVYRYIWIHENYVIKGQSTLSIDETMKILENIIFE